MHSWVSLTIQRDANVYVVPFVLGVESGIFQPLSPGVHFSLGHSVKAMALMCDLHELVVGELPE